MLFYQHVVNGGFFHEGLFYFESIGLVYGIFVKVENCACMVDLIGNVGHLQEAENFINTISCKPNGLVWMALLMVCRVHCNWEMGEQVASLDLEPGNPAGYGLQSSPLLLVANGISRQMLNYSEKKSLV
jgi:hypothetical protein